MTYSSIHTRELNFIDEQQNRLTINAQKVIKERLLSQARERALHEGRGINSPLTIHEYYYDELACFMSSYPSIYIDLILIKLEDHKLN